jgi:hypothetical protein
MIPIILESIGRRGAPWAAGLSLLALAVAGCGTLGGPASASFASVTIKNRSEKTIAAATIQVFRADGYQGGMTESGKMVFEKEASQATTLSREGFVATQYGARTVNRVKVEIVPASLESQRLQCVAYVVRDAGTGFYEDEVRLSNMRAGPYQALLNKVEAQLKDGTPPAPASSP